jgi:hypothetical protein
MALTPHALEIAATYLGPRVLSLGYPDILSSAADIEQRFGVRPTRFHDAGRWHGVTHPLPDTVELFELLGATLECVDIVASRGVERIVDLNQPHDLGAYDLVLDGGTVEHCFNIGPAILNAANAVKPGGHVFHTPPLSMVNHGFYNLNPTLFHDFYTQNGWEVVMLRAADRERTYDIDAVARVRVPSELSVFCVARRLGAAPLRFPTQTKYLRNPDLK